jgi:hypothetical protein
MPDMEDKMDKLGFWVFIEMEGTGLDTTDNMSKQDMRDLLRIAVTSDIVDFADDKDIEVKSLKP